MRLLLCLAAAVLLCSTGCGEKPGKKRTGALKDWIVGNWVRQDDGIAWTFHEGTEFITTGRLPIGGSYGTEEPDKVKIQVSGANAVTAGFQLGFPVDANQNMYATFQVKDDEMRPFGPGAKTSVVFKKQ